MGMLTTGEHWTELLSHLKTILSPTMNIYENANDCDTTHINWQVTQTSTDKTEANC